MYAIAFDLDIKKLKKNYIGQSWNNAYQEIETFLGTKGFTSQQGSLYYGDETVTQVTAILAVVELSRHLPYLKKSLRDIRILQLLNNDNLMPAVVTGNPN